MSFKRLNFKSIVNFCLKRLNSDQTLVASDQTLVASDQTLVASDRPIPNESPNESPEVVVDKEKSSDKKYMPTSSTNKLDLY